MATFFEVKRLICKLFGCNNIEDNDDDVIINIKRRWGEKEYTFSLINQELKNIYDELMQINNDDLELFIEHKYELPINIEAPYLRRVQKLPSSNDFDNHMKYDISYWSVEYCIHVLMMLIDKKALNIFRYNISWRSYRIRNGNFQIEEDGKLDWKKALTYGMREYSIKITCEANWNIEIARKKKTAYIFEFMYKTSIALLEYIDFHDIFSIRKMKQEV